MSFCDNGYELEFHNNTESLAAGSSWTVSRVRTELRLTANVARALAQAVSSRPLIAEKRVRARVSPFEICGTRTGFSLSSSVPPVNIIPPSLSILIYLLGYEQQARLWPQFRDIVSLHRL
jgi:hypothetical protein